jgi:hypothetical protein
VTDGDRLLALKSGNFGGPEFLSSALTLMRRMHSAASMVGHLPRIFTESRTLTEV